MKKFYLLILLIPFTYGFGQNLVQNGGMESWTDGVLNIWSNESGTTISEETSNVSEGNKAALFHVNTANQSNTDFRQESIAVEAGKTYDVSVDVYQLDNTARVRIYADGYSAMYSDPDLVNEWQTITYSFTAERDEVVSAGLRFYDIAGSFDANIGSNIIIDNYIFECTDCDSTTTCDTPSNLVIDNYTTTSFTASWDANEGDVAGYEVFVALEGEDPLTGNSYFTSNTSYSFTDLASNTNYTVAVVAICGEESVSSPITTTAMTLQEVVDACAEGAVTIAVEDFDNSTWGNNISEYLFQDPTDADEGLFIQENTGNNPNFVGNSLYGKDLGGEGSEPTASPYEFTFDSVDVSAYDNVKVSFDYYVFANGDAGSYIVVIDGVASDAVEFYNDPDTDPVVGTIVVDIPEGSSSVSLILQGALNGASDIIELDNFKVCGIERTSECLPPSNVVLTRLSDTTAELTSVDDMNAHYQGTANRAGRPLRARPMYGMTDMTVGHVQTNLVPQFDYSIWLRTICEDGSHTDWFGPYYLPTYVGTMKPAVSLYPNPTHGVIKIDKIDSNTVEVYNMEGILLLKANTTNNQLDISTLPIGKYNLRIVDTKGTVYFKQIMKK